MFAIAKGACRTEVIMELIRIAKRPALTTEPNATIREVCQSLANEKVGALAVVHEGKLVGIISERDIIARVVARGRDPQETPVSEVMTTSVKTVKESASSRQALELMHEGRFRHLPLVDDAGQVLGMISIRDLLRIRIGELDQENEGLMSYISADGPGG
jgi:CBS domain-containing protein